LAGANLARGVLTTAAGLRENVQMPSESASSDLQIVLPFLSVEHTATLVLFVAGLVAMAAAGLIGLIG
jgi:hypothetical protein